MAKVFTSLMRSTIIWQCAILIYCALECIVVWSQMDKHIFPIWSMRFLQLPMMLTMPFIFGSGLYLRLKKERYATLDYEAKKLFSELAATMLVLAYLSIFCCLAQYL